MSLIIKKILRNELNKLNIKEIDVVIDMIGGQYALDSVNLLNGTEDLL